MSRRRQPKYHVSAPPPDYTGMWRSDSHGSQLQLHYLRVDITDRYVNCPGQWIAHISPLRDMIELKATSEDEAKREAVQIAVAMLEEEIVILKGAVDVQG